MRSDLVFLDHLIDMYFDRIMFQIVRLTVLVLILGFLFSNMPFRGEFLFDAILALAALFLGYVIATLCGLIYLKHFTSIENFKLKEWLQNNGVSNRVLTIYLIVGLLLYFVAQAISFFWLATIFIIVVIALSAYRIYLYRDMMKTSSDLLRNYFKK